MHEHWDLPTPPDIVTFAKKMLVGGFYFQEETVSFSFVAHFSPMFDSYIS